MWEAGGQRDPYKFDVGVNTYVFLKRPCIA